MLARNEKKVSKYHRPPTKIIEGAVIFALVCKAYKEKNGKRLVGTQLAKNLNIDVHAVQDYFGKMVPTLEDMFNSNKSVEDFSVSYVNCFADLHIYHKHYCNTFKNGVELLKSYAEFSSAKGNLAEFFKSNKFKYETFRNSHIKHFGYIDIETLKKIPEIDIINKWGAVYTHLEIKRFTPRLIALFEKYRSLDLLSVDMQREFFACLDKNFPGDPIAVSSGKKRKPQLKLPAAKKLNRANSDESFSTILTPITSAHEIDIDWVQDFNEDQFLFGNTLPLFENDQQLAELFDLNPVANINEQMPVNIPQPLLKMDVMDVLREIQNTAPQHTPHYINYPQASSFQQQSNYLYNNQHNQFFSPVARTASVLPTTFLNLDLSQPANTINNTLINPNNNSHMAHSLFNNRHSMRSQTVTDINYVENHLNQ